MNFLSNRGDEMSGLSFKTALVHAVSIPSHRRKRSKGRHRRAPLISRILHTGMYCAPLWSALSSSDEHRREFHETEHH